MKNLKSEKGAITLFVLLACLFFIISLLGVYNYIQNRNQASNSEYQKVKENYEKDIGNEDNLYEKSMENVNVPELTTGMIPIKYDTEKENWVICSSTDKEWYSYTEKDKKWANVMLSDGTYNASTPTGTVVEDEDLGSMFVWIPRYGYKITSGYHSTSGSIDIKFLKGTGYEYLDDDGNTKTARKGTESGVITSSGYTDYIVHPCFTDGTQNSYSNGEWDKELSGIWVSKFQAGIYTTDNDVNQKENTTNLYYPIFKGRKYAYNYINPSQCYNLSQGLDDTGNPYGLNENANSHLMKNSEWGACAYLSISKYGYSGGTASATTEKYYNNVTINALTNVSAGNGNIKNLNDNLVSAITGYTASMIEAEENVISEYSTPQDLVDVINNESYAWNYTDSKSDSGKGTLSSTTGNIYGIYDMGGCLSEFISANMSNESTKFSTIYPMTADTNGIYDITSSYSGWSSIFGDAVYETSVDYGSAKTWYGGAIDEEDENLTEIILDRGGNWFVAKMKYAGLCTIYDIKASKNPVLGFRSVLIVE